MAAGWASRHESRGEQRRPQKARFFPWEEFVLAHGVRAPSYGKSRGKGRRRGTVTLRPAALAAVAEGHRPQRPAEGAVVAVAHGATQTGTGQGVGLVRHRWDFHFLPQGRATIQEAGGAFFPVWRPKL